MENKQKTIYKSLAAFQQEVPTIHKNTKRQIFCFSFLARGDVDHVIRGGYVAGANNL